MQNSLHFNNVFHVYVRARFVRARMLKIVRWEFYVTIVTKMKIVICSAAVLYSRNTENKPWVSGGIVWWDVEASSKLIVDSRTMASQ